MDLLEYYRKRKVGRYTLVHVHVDLGLLEWAPPPQLAAPVDLLASSTMHSLGILFEYIDKLYRGYKLVPYAQVGRLPTGVLQLSTRTQ